MKNTNIEEEITEAEIEVENETINVIHVDGATNYDELSGKPSVNNVELTGNKTLEELGIQASGDYALKEEIPAKISDLTNDKGYITGYTEVDPTVPEWAKSKTKPTYTAQEVGALPDNTPLFSGNYNDLSNKPEIPVVPTKISSFENDVNYISSIPADYKTKVQNDELYQPKGNYVNTNDVPTKVSELENDSGYMTSYEEMDPTIPSHVKSISQNDINNWNSKSNFSGSYDDLSNKPTIPTKTSDLENDSEYLTEIPNTIASKEYVNNLVGNINTTLSTLTTVSEVSE